MQTEDLVLDKGSQGQEVKEVGEVFPDIRIAVLAKALIVEAVDLRDLSGLVVAAQDCDARGIADFEGDEEGDGFDAIIATVDIVAF